jgi:hypothetical protein
MSDTEASHVGKIILGLAVLTVVILIGLHLGFGPRWYQGYAPEQPIPFSHQLHAGQYNIPCLYCHGSAERTAFSAVPGLETCMNCHHAVKVDSPWIQKVKKHYDEGTPIPWVKVHVLPDFVQFNHRPHIAAGVECQTCHGAVEKMEKVYQAKQLSMGWCMDCHRNNDYLTDHRVEVLTKLEGEPQPEWMEWIGGHPEIHNADISCSTCHY